MSTEPKEDEIIVNEDPDGSAVIELPDDVGIEDSGEESHAGGGEVSADDAHDDEVAPPGETEYQRTRREKRRAKRELARKSIAEKDAKLQMIERKNAELTERLAIIEKKGYASEMAQFEKAIENQELQVQYARMKIAEATSARDGEAMAKAQDMLYEARRSLEHMNSLKRRAAQPDNPGPMAPDPRVSKNVNSWMEKNDWFNPDLSDMDSQVIKRIDEALTAEGFNPSDPEYFKELDKRGAKYLPHRYNKDSEPRVGLNKPRRSAVGDSGREFSSDSLGRNTFTLSREQVSAMKDAGFWDNPEKRNKMIRRYAQEARQQSYRS